jgi:hypothetical protein
MKKSKNIDMYYYYKNIYEKHQDWSTRSCLCIFQCDPIEI